MSRSTDLALIRTLLANPTYPEKSVDGEHMTLPEQISALEAVALRLHAELQTAKAEAAKAKADAIAARSTPHPAATPPATGKPASGQGTASGKPLFGAARVAAAIAKANPSS